GTIDKVLYAGFSRGISQVCALLYFTLRADRPVVLDAVDPIHAARRTLQRCRIFKIALHRFNALSLQLLRCLAARIARQRTQIPTLLQHMTDHSPALAPGCSTDKNAFLRIGHRYLPL